MVSSTCGWLFPLIWKHLAKNWNLRSEQLIYDDLWVWLPRVSGKHVIQMYKVNQQVHIVHIVQHHLDKCPRNLNMYHTLAWHALLWIWIPIKWPSLWFAIVDLTWFLEKIQLSKFLSCVVFLFVYKSCRSVWILCVFFLIGTRCFVYIILKDLALLWDSQHWKESTQAVQQILRN